MVPKRGGAIFGGNTVFKRDFMYSGFAFTDLRSSLHGVQGSIHYPTLYTQQQHPWLLRQQLPCQPARYLHQVVLTPVRQRRRRKRRSPNQRALRGNRHRVILFRVRNKSDKGDLVKAYFGTRNID